MANVEFGTGKTLIILSIVAACFAVLWPKIFYPMFTAISNKKVDSDGLDGCCDVMFDSDINAIKIMTEMCGTILNRQADYDPKLSQAFHQGKMSKEVINTCRTEVMNMCGIDIAEFLRKKEKIGHSYKQMLDEIRSFNISVCLRHNFGVNPGLLGAPRRMRIWGPSTSSKETAFFGLNEPEEPPKSSGPWSPDEPRRGPPHGKRFQLHIPMRFYYFQGHLRQERPLHFRPEIIHPALREKGRAIPQSHVVPRVPSEKEPSARPIPMPGMRPPMGGAGHVVPPPKVGGTMSVVMPLYTIGIVIFFMYTVMKVFMKKTGGTDEFKDFHSDPEFRRVVFSEDYSNGCAGRAGEDGVRGRSKQEALHVWKSPTDDSTRLGWKERDTIMSAITGLLAEVDQQLNREGDTQTQYSTELKDKKNLEELCTEEVPATKKKALELKEQVDIVKKEPARAKNGHANVHRDLLGEPEDDESKPKVKVVGLEMMAECEGGQKWSRPATPNLGVGGSSRSATPIPPPFSPEPQNIFLEGALPQQSQLLVTDSKTQALTLPDGDEPEPPVILSSKMTLSLISLDAGVPEEGFRHDQSQVDENFGNLDSTLLDAECDLTDETGENEYESLSLQDQEQEEVESEEAGGKPVNEVAEEEEEPSPSHTGATVSERAEAGPVPEQEDTTTDVSNLDGLDLAEDQEDLQHEDTQLWNGNARPVEEPQDPPEGGDTQQQQQG